MAGKMVSTIDAKKCIEEHEKLLSQLEDISKKENESVDAIVKASDDLMNDEINKILKNLSMVTITGILGQCFGDPTVEQICQIISIGAASAIILIIFILPGILTCLDRFTAGMGQA